MKTEFDPDRFREKEYKRKRGAGGGFDAERASGDDIDAVLRLAIETAESGKIHGYSNDDAGLAEFKKRSIDFLRYIREQNTIADEEGKRRLIPSIEAWGMYCGVSRQTILTYQKCRSEGWQNFIIWMKNSIQGCKTQLAHCGKVPPLIYIFDSVNNSGYENTTSVKVAPLSETIKSVASSESPENISARYKARLADLQENDGNN